MHIQTQLYNLLKQLYADHLDVSADTLLAQVLEIEQVHDLGVITPNHPLYDTLCSLLRPEQSIERKLSDFQQRLDWNQ